MNATVPNIEVTQPKEVKKTNDSEILKVFQSEDCLGTLGDLNQDNIINILDVILLVNLILDGVDNSNLGDMNNDNQINILDVIILVNIILNR